jgi:hypothetical protein
MVAPRCSVIVSVLAFSVAVSGQQGSLTDDEVSTAIRLGQQGKDLSVRVGSISARSTYCDVIVDGPMARVSAAAATAFKQYRPFTAEKVTADVKATTYRVTLRSPRNETPECLSGHIVLQPAGLSGMEGVIQPLQERSFGGSSGAIFDHLPDGTFQIVVVPVSGVAHRVQVSLKDRVRIESPLLAMAQETPAPAVPAPPRLDSAHKPATTSLRLFVQGDGKHLSDAITSLQAELATSGISGTVVNRDEPSDYVIIFGEGQRNAASVAALDTYGRVVGVAVHGAFTEKGAAEGAAREIAKKLVSLSR